MGRERKPWKGEWCIWPTAKIKLCKRKAVYLTPAFGIPLCRKHKKDFGERASK